MDQLTSFTVWDVKDALNKVKNVVMNYTEMESKVREATNNEPWGASTTLMQEIAQGTYNYQYFNEIMPTIYKRFTEKEARQWRQIYKALVLLEYLVKNGCERVVDDARAHMATIKIMRNFSYIDEKGKDQGVNVRNRAKELAELLGDVTKIRNERKKARENRSKYTAISSEQYRYSQGGYSQGGYNSSYGGLPERFGDGSFYERQSRSRYDYYETPDGSNTGESQRESESKSSKRDESEPTSPVANEVNLVNFEDGPTPTTHKSQPSVTSIDDDFADFQVAPTSNRSSIPGPPSNMNASGPQSTRLASNMTAAKPAQTDADLLGDIFGSIAPAPVTAVAPNPLVGNFGAPLTPTVPASSSVMTPTPTVPASNSVLTPSKHNQSSGAPATNDIWANAASLVSLDSLGSKPESKPAVGPSMNSLAQANSAAWTVQGSWASTTQPKPNTSNAPAAMQKPQDPVDLLL